MRTVLTKDAFVAAGFIRASGLVAFPTETVYGLGANVFDEAAVAKIFDAKRRPADNPLIAHIAEVEHIGLLAEKIPRSAQLFIDSFFPGPLTIVLPKSDRVPLIATAGLSTVGIRMPRFAIAHEFITFCGVPVVAPSANLSGKPSPTTWQAVAEDLEGRIDCILQGDETEIGLESTVVDCTGDEPLLLRQGAISLAQLRSVVSETVEYTPIGDGTPRSPGLKHRHYSPRAKVEIIGFEETKSPSCSGMTHTAFIGLSRPVGNFEREKICVSVDDYAHTLFEFFRDCDRNGVHTIYCEKVPPIGVGAAVMDRLRRAAAG